MEQSRIDREAAALDMAPTDEQLRAKLHAAGGQVMAVLVGLTVQEAVSVLCLCVGETVGLLGRHDQAPAVRRLLPSIAAYVVAQEPGRHRWSSQIMPPDIAP